MEDNEMTNVLIVIHNLSGLFFSPSVLGCKQSIN